MAAGVFNSLAIAKCTLGLDLLQTLLLGATLLLLFKMAAPSTVAAWLPLPSQNGAQLLLGKFNQELAGFCWLVNKFTPECYRYLLASLLLSYLWERLAGVGMVWWAWGNVVIVYEAMTRYARSLVKYRLGLYKDYNRYVIHVIEPLSPEQSRQKEV